MKRYIFAILIWLWLTLALLALLVSRTPPFQFLDSSALVLFVESSKLFFIIIILSLIINDFCHENTKTPRIPCSERTESVSALVPWWLSFLDCLKSFIIFLLLSLPLTIITSYLGQTDWGILLRANLLLLLIAGFISLLSFRYTLIYYLAVFLLFGVGPILYYLILELAGASWNALIMINPFRLFWNMNNPEVFNQAWLVQCLIWVTLIIITLAINRISKGKY